MRSIEPVEELLQQLPPRIRSFGKAQGRKPRGFHRLVEIPGEALELFSGRSDGTLGIHAQLRLDERQQGFRETLQVPHHDRTLAAERIASLLVNRAKPRVRIKRIHERARPIINGLAGNRGVIRIHHPMHKPHVHPLRNQLRLPDAHPAEQPHVIPIVQLVCVVPGDGKVRQIFQLPGIALVQHPRELETSHP